MDDHPHSVVRKYKVHPRLHRIIPHVRDFARAEYVAL